MQSSKEEQMKGIAAQLRKPHGQYADEVARKMNEANAHLNRDVIEALNLKSDDVVVEVGMGNGGFVSDVLAKGNAIKYSGCDYSHEMISAATMLNESFVQQGRAIFHETTADNLPFEHGSVDVLFTINTIYFWDNTESVLTEFRRVLRPGGKLVIGMRPRRSMERYPFTRFGFTMYSREEVVALITNAGFNVSEIIENEEPGQEIDGNIIDVESLIVVGTKQRQRFAKM